MFLLQETFSVWIWIFPQRWRNTSTSLSEMLSLILQINYHLSIVLCYARWKLSQLLVLYLTQYIFNNWDITSTSFLLKYSWFGGAFLVAQIVTNLPAMQETQVPFSCWESPMEKGTATHSSILAWRTPWTEEPGRLPGRGCKESETIEWLIISLS